jgi:putative oxidoreductase
MTFHPQLACDNAGKQNPIGGNKMNTALLVLRILPGVLLIGHGLQKLVPARYSPPLLHAAGHQSTGARFEQLGLRPGPLAALISGLAETLGGFSLAAGLLTPVGTILVGADLTAAILLVHARNGIWNAEGGFEFPLVLLAVAFVITALGAGSYSFNHWLDVSNWAGIHWSISDVARAGIVLAIGAGAGLLTVLALWAPKRAPARPSVPAAG